VGGSADATKVILTFHGATGGGIKGVMRWIAGNQVRKSVLQYAYVPKVRNPL
jgi:hypothetical protein